jgi:hypothetical protein
MGHISELALADYLAGKGDLTSQELEHLKECEDCEALAVELNNDSDLHTDEQRAS